MRRGIIGLAVGVCVLSATGVARSQTTAGFANFTDAFTLAYGFQFPNAVAQNSLAFSQAPEMNNMAIQRIGSFDRQGALGDEDLLIPGFEELDAMSLSERDRFGSRNRGVFNRAHRLKTLTANVRHGSPMQFYNRSTQSFYPDAAVGSHRNPNATRRRTSSGTTGGFGGGVGGIGVF